MSHVCKRGFLEVGGAVVVFRMILKAIISLFLFKILDYWGLNVYCVRAKMKNCLFSFLVFMLTLFYFSQG